MSKPLLVADNVRKTFRMGRSELNVLKNARLSVARGEFVTIMGRSGSGKSTLLHILGALDSPNQGEVTFDGRSINHPNTSLAHLGAAADHVLRVLVKLLVIVLLLIFVPGSLGVLVLASMAPTVVNAYIAIIAAVFIGGLIALPVLVALILLRLLLADFVDHRRIALRRRAFGFIFQFYHLLPELNVLENVLLPRMTSKWPWTWLWDGAAARADALATLDRVGLSERLKHRPNELSGGERQRVAIARALIHKPAILFADEPTGNLDADAGRSIMELLLSLHREGQTIVMVTHDPGMAEFSDRLLRLEGGQLREV